MKKPTGKHEARRLGPRLAGHDRSTRVIAAKTGLGGGPLHARALEFVANAAKSLSLDRDISQFGNPSIVERVAGRSLLYQQHVGKVPISRAWVKLDLDPGRTVSCIASTAHPSSDLKAAAKIGTEPRIKEMVAYKSSAAKLKPEGEGIALHIDPELVFFHDRGRLKLCWKLVLISDTPEGAWKAYVNAHTGAVLKVVDLLRRYDSRGYVFLPNPAVRLNDPSLAATATIPNVAYEEKPLWGIDHGSDYLDGQWVSTSPTQTRIKRQADGTFRVRRDHAGFREVMAYHHIDFVQRMLQNAGILYMGNRVTMVRADGSNASFYNSVTDVITLGAGLNAHAEDAEIILHEYGHSIEDHRLPGYGDNSIMAAAIGEGFCDFLAAHFFEATKSEAFLGCIGTWYRIAQGDWNGTGTPCLRRVDRRLSYSASASADAIRQMWSSCLMDLRGLLTPRTALQVALASHDFLSLDATVIDAANAIVLANRYPLIGNGSHENEIKALFADRNIVPTL